MKRIVCFLITIVLLTGCGSANTEIENAKAEVENSVEETESDTTEEVLDESEEEIEVDDGLLAVEVTIPKDLAEDMTQEDADKLADEEGFLSVTLNEDGSITYKMTKKKHGEFLAEMKAELTDFSEYIGTEGYENVSDISANDDLTEFVVYTTSEELNMDESFLSMYFFVAGGMYSTFSGNSVDNIKVVYMNPDTKEVIKEVNSKDQ